MYKLSEKYKKYVKYKEIKNFEKTLAFPVALLYTKQVARMRHKNIGNGRLVKRLRRRPLTAKTGVRFPYRLLKSFWLSRSFLFYRIVEEWKELAWINNI